MTENQTNSHKTIDKISVIVSTYDDPIDMVSQCIYSLLPQEKIYEIVVVDSSKKEYIKKFCHSLKNEKINYIYTSPKGLSDARNKGMHIAKNDIIAFTDSDCIVDKNWADYICSSFTDNIAIIGGKVLPKWISTPNKILLNSAIAQGFYSSFDMGDELKEVDQIFGANFAINRNLIIDQSFSTKLGRKKGDLFGGEELDFCKRIKMRGFEVIYNPHIVVYHQIPDDRIKFKWIWKRMYHGGIMRATLGGRPTPRTVNYVNYNIYDALFCTIFITPYIAGITKGLFFNNTIRKYI